MNERSKYIDICYHFIRDLVEKGDLRVDYIPIEDIVADRITKPLARVAFERFKNQMGLIGKREGYWATLEVNYDRDMPWGGVLSIWVFSAVAEALIGYAEYG